jgi:2-polyprenyl-6-hydroxyphenyl methylase/3-demethylubiquinone-9 3-methyltransferase
MNNCYVCGGELESIGYIPFDRNNAGVELLNVTPMEYARCTSCNSILCPDMLTWTIEKLGSEVYNQDYINYDPDYIEVRPTNYAKYFLETFKYNHKIKHLDYGSGSGIMVDILNKYNNWDSTAFDPYSNNIPVLGKYKLITAIEVFEHSLNTDKLVEELKKYLDKDGVIIFSTLMPNKNTDINWWYIGARNGHINMLSAEAMKMIAIKHKLFFSSISDNMHLLQATRSSYGRLVDG